MHRVGIMRRACLITSGPRVGIAGRISTAEDQGRLLFARVMTCVLIHCIRLLLIQVLRRDTPRLLTTMVFSRKDLVKCI